VPIWMGLSPVPSDFRRSTPYRQCNPHNPLHIGHNECNQVSVTLVNSIDNTSMDFCSNPPPPSDRLGFKFPRFGDRKTFLQIDRLTLGSTIQYNAARPVIISRHAHLEVALFGKVVLEGEMGTRDRIGWDGKGGECTM